MMRAVQWMTITVVWMIVVGCAVARAARPNSARPSSPLGFSITALGFKSYFVFGARPGATVHGKLRVVSLSSRPRTIVLAPVDVSTASAGELQYGNEQPRREGRWVRLAQRRVHLPGRGSTDVPFAVDTPRDALSGEHFVGITAVARRALSQVARGRGAIRLRLIPRLAMTIKLRLPGSLTRKLTVGGARIAVAPSGASLELQIANPANSLIPVTTGNLTVSQDGTPLFTQGIELGAFVPRTTIAYHAPWEGTPVQGTYQVRGELHPAHAPPISFERTITFDTNAIHQYRQQTGRQAKVNPSTSTALIIVLVLALATALAFASAYAHTRRRLHARR